MIQNVERFKNRKKAFDWLQQEGYQLSERTFYNICETGCPAVALDKTLSCFEVGEYLRKHEAKIRKQPGSNSGIREDAETRKAVADAKKAEIIAEQLQRELNKKLISSEESALESCTWTALLRGQIAVRLTQTLPTLIKSIAYQIVQLPEVHAVIDQAIADACNDISDSGEL